jgi:hypothetical protein
MDVTLHVKQGVSLLERVLSFYPFMQDGNESIVVLSEQDWLVLMDFIENPETTELYPTNIKNMVVDRSIPVIKITTDNCNVQVKMG